MGMSSSSVGRTGEVGFELSSRIVNSRRREVSAFRHVVDSRASSVSATDDSDLQRKVDSLEVIMMSPKSPQVHIGSL